MHAGRPRLARSTPSSRYLTSAFRRPFSSFPQASLHRVASSHLTNPNLSPRLYDTRRHLKRTRALVSSEPLQVSLRSIPFLQVRMASSSTPAAIGTSQNVVVPYIPELNDPKYLDILLPITPIISPPPAYTSTPGTPLPVTEVAPKNPLMEALKETSNWAKTDNDAMAYGSTGDPVLDFFYSVKRFTPGTALRSKLEAAWAEDPATTLRVIWNARSIHDGKGEKEVFYQAWGWLYEKHPRTAIENLPQLVKPLCKINKEGDLAPHGYWKDLLNLLCLAALDQLGPSQTIPTFLRHPKMESTRHLRPDRKKKPKVTAEELKQRKVDLAQQVKARREKRHAELHENTTTKLNTDKRFRALYITVARLFAEQLAQDILTLDKIHALPPGKESFKQRKTLDRQVSLAGKWAPTPGCTHDRHTNIATTISLLIHFSQAFQTPSGLSITSGTTTPISALEAHILRSFYQRWVLRPLRTHAACPEPLMSSNRWTEIKYNRVPSQCMSRNMPHFYIHDPEGYTAYLSQVEKGKKKMSGATLKPHELLQQAVACWGDLNGSPSILSHSSGAKVSAAAKKKLEAVAAKLAEAKSRTVEAQWKTMVDRVREAGTLENALALCDVSGSMGALSQYTSFNGDEQHVEPIWPAVALSIVLAQVAKPPFNGGFITFSESPQYIQLNTTQTVGGMAMDMQKTDWGMNTNFDAVFLKLLLPLAKKNQVKPEDMVKRLFVFSDMQFDASLPQNLQRTPGGWETNHDVIERAYKEAGYEVPELVYWNLAGETSTNTTPVTGEKKGVALMSGYSPAMLKVFMGQEDEDEDMEDAEGEEDEDGWEKVGKTKKERKERVWKEKEPMTPKMMMMKAVGKPSYAGLVVVD